MIAFSENWILEIKRSKEISKKFLNHSKFCPHLCSISFLAVSQNETHKQSSNKTFQNFTFRNLKQFDDTHTSHSSLTRREVSPGSTPVLLPNRYLLFSKTQTFPGINPQLEGTFMKM